MTKKWKRKQRTKIKQGKNRNICFFWLSIIQIFFVFVHLSLFIRKSKLNLGLNSLVSYLILINLRGGGLSTLKRSVTSISSYGSGSLTSLTNGGFVFLFFCSSPSILLFVFIFSVWVSNLSLLPNSQLNLFSQIFQKTLSLKLKASYCLLCSHWNRIWLSQLTPTLPSLSPSKSRCKHQFTFLTCSHSWNRYI